jgi:Holliday junction resolvasome RuvABC endonuclease subunit
MCAPNWHDGGRLGLRWLLLRGSEQVHMLTADCPIVLGVDCSFRKPGLAVLDTTGRLLDWRRPDYARDPRHLVIWRLFELTRDLCAEWRPGLVAIEDSSNVPRETARIALHRMGEAVGAVVAGALDALGIGVEVRFYSPLEARAAVTPRSSKEAAVDALKLFGYELPLGADGAVLTDVSDAICCALKARDDYRIARWCDGGQGDSRRAQRRRSGLLSAVRG